MSFIEYLKNHQYRIIAELEEVSGPNPREMRMESISSYKKNSELDIELRII
jgi:hypothetical protein